MCKSYLPNLLAVGCWNIEGLYKKVNGVKLCKMDKETFQTTRKKFDILCLQEIHTAPEDTFRECEEFYLVPHCRRKSANNRYFGGFLLLIRKGIRKGIKIDQKSDRDMIVVTLGKNFFGMENDIEIIFTYASPINSCYTKSRTDNVLDKIQTTMINRNDNGIIMGDLNGRTKVADDFVRDSEDIYSPVNNQLYVKDEVLSRLNLDKTSVDGQGKLILELCKSSSYRILNGRIQGDRMGKFTRYSSNIQENPSLIDYSLCSVGAFKADTLFFCFTVYRIVGPLLHLYMY